MHTRWTHKQVSRLKEGESSETDYRGGDQEVDRDCDFDGSSSSTMHAGLLETGR
jgi:hypothetical protein